ncbi:MAG: 16S rRNA (cytosine(967)-C(5))-methyltransferase RsmB [Firmicutes bacterium]|nr:16S rRNA (cytosine(967)-C(5))-methyltransferase RsmB [Bacillota bacterium]
MPSAREAALDILLKIGKDRAYGNILLRNALEALQDARERAFATELANGCLRNLIFLDHAIGSVSAVPVGKLKPVILGILRVGAYQLLFLERVPASAAVDEAVKAARRRGFGNLAGFVNAVLRNIARKAEAAGMGGQNGAFIKEAAMNNAIKTEATGIGSFKNEAVIKEAFGLPDFEREPLRRLSVEYSVPMWIVETVAAQRGLEKAADFCRGSAGAPYVGLCVNTLKTDRHCLIGILKGEGAEVAEEVFHENFVSVTGFSGIAERKSFLDGLYHVMDPGAAAPVDMLAPEPGDEVLDMCAAPGGKAFYAAYKMADRGLVAAWDVYPRKVGLIAESARRLGVTAVAPELMDAAKPRSSRKYGKVLLDAPCSGLGVLKKKPDIRYSLRKEDLAPLAAIQRELLASAAELCAPGGLVVYSTCTVNADENEANAAWFAERFGFGLEKESVTFPRAGADGFYAAALRNNICGS